MAITFWVVASRSRSQGVHHALEHPGNRNKGRDEGHETDSREADASGVVDPRSRTVECHVPAIRSNDANFVRSDHASRQSNQPDNARYPLSERSPEVDRSETWK